MTPPATKMAQQTDDDSVTVVDERFFPGATKTTGLASSPKTKDAVPSPQSIRSNDAEEEVASPSAAKNEESPEVEIFSPATLTLNALSQNMGDLRATRKDDHQEDASRSSTVSKTASRQDPPPAPAAATSKPLPMAKENLTLQQWKTYYQDQYDWVSVQMPAPRQEDHGFGMTIQRDQFGQLASSKSAQSDREHCFILDLKPGGVAQRHGLQLGDWICHAKQEKTACPVLATFERVQQWAKGPGFEISVLRVKTRSSTTQQPKSVQVKESSLNKSEDTTPAPSKPLIVAGTESKPEAAPPRQDYPTPSSTVFSVKPDLESVPSRKCLEAEPSDQCQPPPCESGDSDVMPFCRLCLHVKKYGPRSYGQRKPRAHHSWCSKNPFFSNNGSKELLERIQQGRNQLHCNACEKEFTSGKLEPPKNHSQLCLQNQRRIKAELRRQEEEEKLREQEESQKKKRQQQQHAKNERQPKKRKQQDMMLSSSSDDDEDGLLNYLPVAKKKKSCQDTTIRTSSYKAKCKHATTKDRTPNNSQNSRSPPVAAQKKKPAKKATSSLVPRQVSPQPPPVVPPKPMQEPNKHATFKPIWESTDENPWGQAGFQDGDVLLYGPKKGAGHYETLLPSPRYALHPFVERASYRTTHKYPACISVSVHRDPSAQIPWGLEVSRDEFGHACLIKSVQPLSPASRAAMVGSPDPIALNIHDMILMVNGRPVGGMTEVGLELELEVCGPSLFLVVAQYKYTQTTQSQRSSLEIKQMQAMDELLRDDRIIGWREIGCRPQEALPVVRSTDEEASLNGRELNQFVPILVSAEAMETEESDGETRPDASNPDVAQLLRKNVKDNFSQRMDQNQRAFDLLPMDTSTPRKRDDKSVERSVVAELSEAEAAFPSKQYSDLIQKCILDRQVVGNNSNDPHAYSSGSEDDADAEACNTSGKDEWEEDDNAWNGCVCGAMHKESRMFWIQCEVCDSWYDVAERCVGFSEKQAERLGKWTCWACDFEDSPVPPPNGTPSPSDDASAANAIIEARQSAKGSAIFSPPKADLQRSPHEQGFQTEIAFQPAYEAESSIAVASHASDLRLHPNVTRMRRGLESTSPEMEHDDTQKAVCGIPKSTAVDGSQSPEQSIGRPETSQPTHKKRKELDIRHRPLKQTPDGDLISNSKPITLEDNTFKRPPGKAPRGFSRWNKFRGVWIADWKGDASCAHEKQERNEPHNDTYPASSRARHSREDSAIAFHVDEEHFSKKLKVYSDGRPPWYMRKLNKTKDGDLISNSKPIKLEDGTFKKPPGCAPKGFSKWNKFKGVWTADWKGVTSPSAKPKVNDSNLDATIEKASTSPNRQFKEKVDEQLTENLRVYSDGRCKLKKTKDGDLISNSELIKLGDGTFKKPTGRLPNGYRWDEYRGVWTRRGRESNTKNQEHQPHSVNRPQPQPLRSKKSRLQMTDNGDLISNFKPLKLDDGTFRRPPGQAPNGYVWDKHRCVWTPDPAFSGLTESQEYAAIRVPISSSKDNRSTASSSGNKPYSEMEEVKGDGDVHIIFKVGDMVDVTPHAWPTVNNVGGVGKIAKAYLDEDGEQRYDVKYTVSRHMEKGIFAEWVKACHLGIS